MIPRSEGISVTRKSLVFLLAKKKKGRKASQHNIFILTCYVKIVKGHYSICLHLSPNSSAMKLT